MSPESNIPSPHHPSSPQSKQRSVSLASLFASHWTRMILVWLVVAGFYFFGSSWLQQPLQPVQAIIVFVVLFLTILVASFSVVQQADYLAERLGEPYGTLILTISIVLIEVILISSILLGEGDFPSIGKEAIYSVMMIILNLVMGLAIIMGAKRFGHQYFNRYGTFSYCIMIVILASIALLLPNFMGLGGALSPMMAIICATFTLGVYMVFLFAQTGRLKSWYQQPEYAEEPTPIVEKPDTTPAVPIEKTSKNKAVFIHSLYLILFMLPVIILGHDLAIIIDYGLVQTGAPLALGGVIIATIVFLPESITALKASLNNEMQRVINLCLGAFLSTVGFTVPAVLTIGLVTGKTVLLGTTQAESWLFIITMLAMFISFSARRTHFWHGIMHLIIFGLYCVMLFMA